MINYNEIELNTNYFFDGEVSTVNLVTEDKSCDTLLLGIKRLNEEDKIGIRVYDWPEVKDRISGIMTTNQLMLSMGFKRHPDTSIFRYSFERTNDPSNHITITIPNEKYKYIHQIQNFLSEFGIKALLKFES